MIRNDNNDLREFHRFLHYHLLSDYPISMYLLINRNLKYRNLKCSEYENME